MAVININAGGTWTFASTDTVTFTASHTQGNGNSVTKTDTAAMTMYVASGVTVTVSGTGYIDIQGSRGNFVTIMSSASSPRDADWAQFAFTGSSTSNTMKWIVLKQCTYGIYLNGHTPAAGKFQYIVYIGDGDSGCCFNNTANTGTVEITDVAILRQGSPLTKSADCTATYSRWQVMHPGYAAGYAMFSGVTRSTTIADFHVISDGEILEGFAPASTYTVGVTGYYRTSTAREVRSSFAFSAGAGALNVTTFQIRGGGTTVWHSHATGIATLTGGDIFDGWDNFQGAYSSTANKLVLDDVAIYGTYGYDFSVFDPTTDQSFQTSNSNMRTTAKFPTTATITATNGSVGAYGFTVTGTTGSRAKARIIYGTTSGVYTGATEWDAPDLRVSPQYVLPSSVIDWVNDGKKYSTNLNGGIALTNLKPGTTYYLVIEAMDMMGQVYRSSESTQATDAAPASGGGGGSNFIFAVR